MTTPLSISYTSEETKKAALDFANKHDYPCNNQASTSTSLNLNYTDKYVELKDNNKNISIHIVLYKKNKS